MKNNRNLFKTFLKKHGFLPLDRWNRFGLEHGKEAIFENNIEKIRTRVKKKSGIYAYKKGEKILYVGKGNPLFDRIKSHNRASFKSVPGDTKWNTWHKFFSHSKNIGKVKVYWKEVKIEAERVILEKILAYVLEPKFESFKKKIEGKN